jgi:hypothetical protein
MEGVGRDHLATRPSSVRWDALFSPGVALQSGVRARRGATPSVALALPGLAGSDRG